MITGAFLSSDKYCIAMSAFRLQTVMQPQDGTNRQQIAHSYACASYLRGIEICKSDAFVQ